MKITFIDRKSGKIKQEHPPAEKLLHFLYSHPFGKVTLLPLIKRKFISSIYGKRMNTFSSIKKIKPFVKELKINMEESLKPITAFTSFNDFFYRKLKPNARPIEEGFTAVGDGRLLAFENITDINKFYIKGREFTLLEFLNNSKLAKKYETASLLILRLAPNDYHRFHFPYAGIPSKINLIKGYYYSVSPYALIKNFTTVFCENKRAFCELKTKDKGDILIAPIGATMVGSIISTFTPNKPICKGDEMGYFAFGGSTVLLLVDNNKIKIAADILKNTQNKLETFVKMGEKIGS